MKTYRFRKRPKTKTGRFRAKTKTRLFGAWKKPRYKFILAVSFPFAWAAFMRVIKYEY
jgi:hypothetical protein